MWVENLRDGRCAQERSQRQRHFAPVCGIAADGKDSQPDNCRSCRGEDGDGEALQRTAQAEPGREHGHELGVAEAHAFHAADQPVGEADDEDEAASRDDCETTFLCGFQKTCGFAELQFGLDEGEKYAESDAREGQHVGQPEILRIKCRECKEQPAQDGVANELSDAVCSRNVNPYVSDSGNLWRTEPQPTRSPEKPHSQFNQRISDADPGAALAAASAQQNPAQNRQIFPPGEDMVAMAAVGAGMDDAFVFRKARQNDVKKAAEGQPEEPDEDCPDPFEFADD